MALRSRPRRRRWPAALAAGLVLLLGGVMTAGIVGHARASAPSRGGALTDGPPPPPGQPGSPVVALSTDAMAHPRASAVRSLLQAHFDSINNGDYDAWTSTVVSNVASQQSRARWTRDLRSTRDGNILVSRIDPAGADDLLVLLSFISVQVPEDAPPELRVARICWQTSDRLVTERGGLRVDTRRAGSMLREPC